MRLARGTKNRDGAGKTPRDDRPEAEAPETEAGSPGSDAAPLPAERVEDAVILSDGPSDETAKTAATSAMSDAARDDAATNTSEGGMVIDGTADAPADAPRETLSDDLAARNADEAAGIDTAPPGDEARNEDPPETSSSVPPVGARANKAPPDLDLAADPAIPDGDVPPAGAGMGAPPDLGDGSRPSDMPPPQVIEKRGPGFLPLILGGLLAGLIGYSVSTFVVPGLDPELVAEAPVLEEGRVAALEAEIAALRDAIPAPVDPVDLSPLEAAQTDLSERLAALEAEVANTAAGPGGSAEATGGPATGASTAGLEEASRLDALRSDLANLSSEVSALSDALAALDVASLRDRVDGLAEELDAIDLAPVTTGIDDVASRVSTLEERAAENADTVAAVALEAARDQLALAVESGLPYADPLSRLPDPPAELTAFAETGVATAQELAAEFPPLAREALRVARADATLEGGFGAIAGRFLNARSVEPREGADPDAVLSRVEAAIRAGNVEAALEEIDALPPAAREPLAGWASRAEARRLVEATLDDYLQEG
jgi:hypothetical protein